MKLKEVVVRLKKIRDQAVDVSKARKESLVEGADRVSLLLLDQLIFSLAIEGEREFHERDRLAIKGFLADHWHWFSRTNADYFMNPHGRITSVFKALARYTTDELFRAVHFSQDKNQLIQPWLAVMVPTLSDATVKQVFNSGFDFYYYVIKKNLSDLVDIRSAFLHGEVKPGLNLDASVVARVKAHDPITTQMGSLKNTAKRVRSQREVQLKQKMFSVQEKLNSSYPEERTAHLEKAITQCQELVEQNWVATARSLECMLDYMTDYLPCDQWPDYVSVFEKEKVKALLQADVAASRALAYVSIYNYACFRKAGDDYHKRLAVFSGAPSKEVKLSVVNKVLQQLHQGKTLAEVADYLNSDALTVQEKNAAVNGGLGELLKKFFLENPALKKAVEPEVASGGYLASIVSYAGNAFSIFGGSSAPLQPAPDFGKEAVHRPT